MSPYKVFIVGAGQMAAGYDSRHGPQVLTHAHGFSINDQTEVFGICDIDVTKAKNAAEKWNIPFFGENLEVVIKNSQTKPDIICICSPDSTHEVQLLAALSFQPKIVFCEKPIGLNADHVENLVQKYQNEKVLLAVNYSRRWVKAFEKLRVQANSGHWGEIETIRIKYSGEFLHVGSHLIDLLMFVFPELEIKNGSIIKKLPSLSKSDAGITAACTAKLGQLLVPFYIEAYDAQVKSFFECEWVFAKARVLLSESGGAKLNVDVLSENSVYKGYWEFKNAESDKINESEAMIEAVKNIVDSLNSNEKFALKSSGQTALRTLQVAKQIEALPNLN